MYFFICALCLTKSNYKDGRIKKPEAVIAKEHSDCGNPELYDQYPLSIGKKLILDRRVTLRATRDDGGEFKIFKI